MMITVPALEALRTGFKLNFQAGIKSYTPKSGPMCTEVNSSTKIETYGFLKEWPIFREWIGEKRIKSLEEVAYVLANRPFETTIGIHKDKIEDDNLGLYGPMIEGWGQEAVQLPDRLAFEALALGHQRPCFDNQNFFDVSHPVKGGTVANMGGDNTRQAWFLLDLSKSLKPLLRQTRKAPEFKMVTDPTDSKVFETGEYLAGGEARGAVGYTFWQLAYRSTSAITAASYQAAKAAMAALTNDEGEPLGVRPTHLVAGVSNVAAAKELIKQNLPGGESNVLYNEVTIIEADRMP